MANFKVVLELEIYTNVLAHSIKTELLLDFEKKNTAFNNLDFYVGSYLQVFLFIFYKCKF